MNRRMEVWGRGWRCGQEGGGVGKWMEVWGSGWRCGMRCGEEGGGVRRVEVCEEVGVWEGGWRCEEG